MHLTWRTELPQLLLVAAMFALAAAFWPSTSNQIPIHWNLSGQPDRYGGKFEGLLLMPLTALGLYLLLLLLPKVDPKRANYEVFRGTYLVVRLAVLVFLALIYGFILLWIRGIQLKASMVFPVLGGALFIAAGLLIGRIRPNWFVGIRTPWTLSSELSWRKTHQLGRWMLALVGVVFIGSGLVGTAMAFVAAMIFLFAVSLLLTVYSYWV